MTDNDAKAIDDFGALTFKLLEIEISTGASHQARGLVLQGMLYVFLQRLRAQSNDNAKQELDQLFRTRPFAIMLPRLYDCLYATDLIKTKTALSDVLRFLGYATVHPLSAETIDLEELLSIGECMSKTVLLDLFTLGDA